MALSRLKRVNNMAMNAVELEKVILTNLESKGFMVNNEYSQAHIFAKAVAEAVVEHIQLNAKAIIAIGSSAGEHPIQ